LRTHTNLTSVVLSLGVSRLLLGRVGIFRSISGWAPSPKLKRSCGGRGSGQPLRKPRRRSSVLPGVRAAARTAAARPFPCSPSFPPQPSSPLLGVGLATAEAAWSQGLLPRPDPAAPWPDLRVRQQGAPGRLQATTHRAAASRASWPVGFAFWCGHGRPAATITHRIPSTLHRIRVPWLKSGGPRP